MIESRHEKAPSPCPWHDRAMDRDAGGHAPLLTVAAVARRLGVAPATLRTWDRRYGLGPSQHPAGSHRRYGTDDLARLIVMRRLTIDGVAPSEAAHIAAGVDTGGLLDPTTPVTQAEAPDAVASDSLVDAALAADADALARVLAIPPGGDVLQWWTLLVEPAIAALSRRTLVELPGVAPLIVLGDVALAALYAATPAPAAGRPVVLVFAPGMRIGLVGAHSIAAALATRGVDARVVSGAVTARHAVELTAMTRASATVTVTDGPAPELSAVERLAAERPEVPQYVMLPDAAAELLPLGRSVHRARTVPGVVHEVVAAVGLTGTGHPRTAVRSTPPSHIG